MTIQQDYTKRYNSLIRLPLEASNRQTVFREGAQIGVALTSEGTPVILHTKDVDPSVLVDLLKSNFGQTPECCPISNELFRTNEDLQTIGTAITLESLDIELLLTQQPAFESFSAVFIKNPEHIFSHSDPRYSLLISRFSKAGVGSWLYRLARSDDFYAEDCPCVACESTELVLKHLMTALETPTNRKLQYDF